MSVEADRNRDRKIKALERTRVRMRQGTVASLTPLTVYIGGSDVAVAAMGINGDDYTVADRVSILQWGTDLLVVGRPTDDPAAGGTGGPYQPLDSDLSAIAALTTTSYGRGFLDLADAAAAITYLGAISAASAASTYQPLDSDLTAIAALTTASFGRSLLAETSAANARSTLGAAATSHTHAQSDITSLVSDLALKAPLASPALTGNPTAPTQIAGNNSTRVATTAYVDGADATASTADRARANHTGTQLASTISNFDSQVRTSRVDQMATPTADWSNGSKKITSLLPGTTTGNAVEYDQMTAGDAAARLGFTFKPSVYAASIAALPAHGRVGDVLTATANGFLSPSFGTYQFTWASGSSGTGNGQFNQPFDCAVDSSGNVFVTDRLNNRVQKFNSSGTYQSKFTVNVGFGFSISAGIAIDSSGNIWTTEYNATALLGYLVKYNSSGTFQASYALDGGLPTGLGISIDSSGNVFVSQKEISGGSSVYNVKKYNSSGVYQSTVGSGLFDVPSAIAHDGSNNLFVADTVNHCIQKFNSSGTYQSQFGSYGTADGSMIAPAGIAIDSGGNIWVSEYYGCRIQKFNSSGTFQAKLSQQGSGNGYVTGPRGIAFNSTDDIYVADTLNNRFQKFGAFTLTAGVTGGVLVKDEGGGSHLENGLYDVTNAGSAGTKWVLTRRADASTGYLKPGNMVIAQKENTATNRVFFLSTEDPITVNTTALQWSRFEPGGPPSLHSSNHQPGSIDALPTAAASTLSGINSEGTAVTFARSDHNHAMPDYGTFHAGQYMTGGGSMNTVANTAYYCQVQILNACTLTGIQFFSFGVTGTCKVAIFDSAGTRLFYRNAASGTLSVGSLQIAFDTGGPYTVTPGYYAIELVTSAAVPVAQAIAFRGGSVAVGSYNNAASITFPSNALTTPTMSTY